MAELSTYARPYAKAAFEFAQKRGELAKWSEFLQVLSGVSRQCKIVSLLEHPVITDLQKVDILSDLCQETLTKEGRHFLVALSENKRLSLLAEVAQQFEALKAELEKSVDVEITSAFEISQAQINRLTQALKSTLNLDIQVIFSVDPKLIGGAVIRAGDRVIDGSVLGKLHRLAEAMNS